MDGSERYFQKRREKRIIFPYASIIFSLLLIILGAIVLFLVELKSGFDWRIVLKNNLRSDQQSVSSRQPKFNPDPTKLYIPKLSKTLDISAGKIIDGRWEISPEGVSFLVTSAIPGTLGNSVIYGHNRLNILGDLNQLSKGDVIFVVLDSGNFAKFRVFETKKILPTEIGILNQSSDSRLTIYTCSGFLDQARFVVLAKLENIS